MINLGYFKPLSYVIRRFKHYRPYGWEVFSFGCWLIEKYGSDKYIELYKGIISNRSLSVFKEVYEATLNDLEREWLDFLKKNYSFTESFTRNTILILAVRRPVIIYDDSFANLKGVAIKVHEVLKKVAERNFEIKPWKYNITLLPYSLIKDRLPSIFREHDAVIVSLSNSTLFKESSKFSRNNYLMPCKEGFTFMDKCYVSENDTVFLVGSSKYGKLLGFFIGNSVYSMEKDLPILLTYSYGSGGCHINSTFFIIFPIAEHVEIKRKETINIVEVIFIVLLNRSLLLCF